MRAATTVRESLGTIPIATQHALRVFRMKQLLAASGTGSHDTDSFLTARRSLRGLTGRARLMLRVEQPVPNCPFGSCHMPVHIALYVKWQPALRGVSAQRAIGDT